MATTDKYDRQLRLWGAQGQRALAATTVVLVNATAAGTETLKNLVLPGVGAVHVVDGADGPAVPESIPGTLQSEGEGEGDGEGDGDGDGDGAGEDGSVPPSPAFSNFFVFDDRQGPAAPGSPALGTVGCPSRAEIACRHLTELNPDVAGSHTTVPSLSSANYGLLLDEIASRVGSGSAPSLLLVASDLTPPPLLALSRAAWDRSIPLLIVRTCGLVGTIRLQVEAHPVVESKPDSAVPDLRLADPTGSSFPGLRALADGTDLASLSDADHSHVPYVILLLKALQRWRTEAGREAIAADPGGNDLLAGEVRRPRTQDEKEAFRRTIRSMARNYANELNFQEAHADAYLAYAERDLPWEVQDLLSEVTADTLAASIARSGGAEDEGGTGGNTSASVSMSVGGGRRGDRAVRFDLLLLSLKRFLEKSGGSWPPLEGSIPDMTAATGPYIALQEAYRNRAEEDRAAMRSIAADVVSEQRARAGRGSAVPDVTDEDTATFCRNVHNLRRVGTRSYVEEWESHGPGAAAAAPGGEDCPMITPQEEEIRSDLVVATMDPYEVPEHTPLLWHIALRAVDAFREKRGRYPGTPLDASAAALETDAADVQSLIGPIASSMGLAETDLVRSVLLGGSMAHAKELTRYGNAELHNVASVLGGVASQEAVKIITGQYVPLDNTYVYNGIAGTAGVYRL